MTINASGTQVWRNAAGEYHRDDGPAIVWSCGGEMWYRKGQLHRDEGPELTLGNGMELWSTPEGWVTADVSVPFRGHHPASCHGQGRHLKH